MIKQGVINFKKYIHQLTSASDDLAVEILLVPLRAPTPVPVVATGNAFPNIARVHLPIARPYVGSTGLRPVRTGLPVRSSLWFRGVCCLVIKN